MATLCMVIEVRYNPVNKQTQLQLVTQFSSQGQDPVLDHPRECLGCAPSWPASPAHSVPQPRCTISTLWPKPTWYLQTTDHLPLFTSKPHSHKSKVFGMLSGGTEFLFHNQKPNIK